MSGVSVLGNTLIEKEEIKTPSDFVETLHPELDKHGKQIVVFTPDLEKKNHVIDAANVKKFLKDLPVNTNGYVTPNIFHKWRKLNLLYGLKALYIDIDVHGGDENERNEKLSSIVSETNKKLKKIDWPAPNLIIETGRGVHLYWLFSNLVSSEYLDQWKMIQSYLVEAVEGDRRVKDATRVLRLVGTQNTKVGKMVECKIVKKERYDFFELLQIYENKVEQIKIEERIKNKEKIDEEYKNEMQKILNEMEFKQNIKEVECSSNTQKKEKNKKTTKQVRKRQKGSGKIGHRRSMEAWYKGVHEDIHRIIKEKLNGIVTEGYRNKFLFYLINTSVLGGMKTSYSEAREWAEKYIPSYSLNEVDECCRSVIQANGYPFNKALMIEIFGEFITEELRPMMKGIVSDEDVKKRRQKNKIKKRRVFGIRPLEEYWKNSRKKIRPWIQLGISERTYYRWLANKKIQEIRDNDSITVKINRGK